MAYEPRFTITSEILRLLGTIQTLNERIQKATIQLPILPFLQKDMVARSAHGSSAIEGNPLSLQETRNALEGGRHPLASQRSLQEVRNTASAIRYIQKHAGAKNLREKDIFKIHALIGAQNALDRGPVGAYRNYAVRVGDHIAPHWSEIHHYMGTLLEWVNAKGEEWPAVVTSAVLHFRFEHIHPFGDGNGRTGRALAAWELYRRKFDNKHIFSVDELLWEHRPGYYAALRKVERSQPQDLTPWIQFMAEMVQLTLERTWERVNSVQKGVLDRPLHLTPRQEKLLVLLRGEPMRPVDLQKALKLTKGGLHFLLKPLLLAGLVRREGGHKSGVYRNFSGSEPLGMEKAR